MKVRYLIKFSKESNIKFISHLDLMRTIQRVIRRAELPIEYSKGFNPHMTVSLAQPLSVGMYSSGEYMDIVLTEELSEIYIKDKLNDNAPSGIKFFEVVKIKNHENEKKLPQSMALIDAADYIIKIKYKDSSKLEQDIEGLLKQENWNTIKKSKSGEKEVDIKPLVKSFKYSICENILEVDAKVSCGSKENLSAELLASFIKENTNCADSDAFVDIKRNELFIIKGEKFTPLYNCLR